MESLQMMATKTIVPCVFSTFDVISHLYFITDITKMILQNNQGASTGIEAKELEIPTFSGETRQYQGWKKTGESNNR